MPLLRRALLALGLSICLGAVPSARPGHAQSTEAPNLAPPASAPPASAPLALAPLALAPLALAPLALAPLALGGTGGALGALRDLGSAFHQRSGIKVVVLPSLGTQGGIRAAADGVLDIAVVGRDLTEAERARDLRRLLVLRTPYGFATSMPRPPSLAIEVFAAYLAEPRTRWPDGTPVRVILRPSSESDYAIIHASFPGTREAFARLRQRGDIPIAPTDQENLDLAENIPGSLVGTTLAQVVTEGRRLQFVPVNGIRPSIEAVGSGMYAVTKSFHFHARTRPPDRVTAFMAFVGSEEGQAILRRCAILP